MGNLLQKPENLHKQDAFRVYFCCHPQDFRDYFELLSDIVLEAQSCVIYYAAQETPRTQEFLESLSEINLFLMPVTARLLHEENVAMATELPFALEKHIPVLPIIMDGSIYDDFNERFAHRHALSIRDEEFTAKLEAYLRSRTVGQRMIQDIQNAFEASVFLSYRKKDRANAKELIRLVRQNDFCRDVSIWFDDYLVPGENFDDAIKTQLLRSDLFLLALTPNICEEGNYVARHEIPAACNNHIPIVAAELVGADFSQLYSQFAALPHKINAYDRAMLANALANALQKVSFTERNSDPEHCYRIGLAYLDGIHVEVNPSMAERLLVQAAHAGHEQATDKLIEMYIYGNGVQQDYLKASYWKARSNARLKTSLLAKLRELVELKEAAEQNGGSMQARYEYQRAIRIHGGVLTPQVYDWCEKQIELAQLLQQSGDFPRAKAVLQQTIAFVQENQEHLDQPLITNLNEMDTSDLDLFVALAECMIEAEDVAGAQQCLRQFRERVLQGDGSENDKKLNLIRINLEYAKLLYRQHRYVQADRFLTTLIENNRSVLLPQPTLENLLSDYATTNLRYSLLREYGVLSGLIDTALHNFEDAVSSFQLAIQANTYLGSNRDWKKHFYCEFRMIEVYCAMGDRKQAQEKLDEVSRLIKEEFSYLKAHHAWRAELHALQNKIHAL